MFRDGEPKRSAIKFSVYDFMLLRLKKKLSDDLPYSSFAWLPLKTMDEKYLEGKQMTTNGWGSVLSLTRQERIDIASGKIPSDGPNSPYRFPLFLHTVTLPHLRNDICQKRYTEFFEDYKSVKGTLGTMLGQLDFTKEPGLAMLCTSSCTAEDISKCGSASKGTCTGDSGCKL